MISSPSLSGWESTAWSANGLLTPPTHELELLPENDPSYWDVLFRQEDYDYPLGAPSDSRCSPKKACYQDFLGTGPGLLGTDLDLDPDLIAMRYLKNRYSKTTAITNTRILPSTPITPPLTPRLPLMMIPEKDNRWVQCSAANDGDGMAIRGWSPPCDDRFPAVQISFDGWNSSLDTSITRPLATPAPPKIGIGLGLNVVPLRTTDSQETICVGDTLQTPRASGLSVTPRPLVGRMGEDSMAHGSQNTGMQPVYSRRQGLAPVTQNVGQVTRRRNAMGVFTPGSVSLCAQSTSNAQQPRLALQPSFKPKVKPTSIGKGWAQEPEPSEMDAKPKARPLALLPPHLARSITRNAAATLAQDCENSRKKAAEDFPQSPASYWSSASAGSQSPPVDLNAVATNTLPPKHAFTHPQWQEHSPEIPIAPPCTPVLSLDSYLDSPSVEAFNSQSQNFNAKSLLPPQLLPTPVSIPARLPLRLGRTASDPGSLQLLRNLAASLSREFTREVKPWETVLSQDSSPPADVAETQGSPSDAVISAVCAWAATSGSGASSVGTDGSFPEQQACAKRQFPVEDHEQPTAKKLRVV